MQLLSNVPIETVCEGNRALSFLDSIRLRAYELFRNRGAAEGNALDDWLQAERELFVIPEAELTEKDQAFELRIEVPGFSEKNLMVTAMPDSLIVTGEFRDECMEKSVFRRFDLPVPVNVDEVLAKLDNGVLSVTAPKVPKMLPMSVAA